MGTGSGIGPWTSARGYRADWRASDRRREHVVLGGRAHGQTDVVWAKAGEGVAGAHRDPLGGEPER